MLTLKTNLKRGTGLVACVLSLQTAVQALSLAMCSSENTGTSNLQSTYQFNSNGYCHDKCDGYAYAIVQGESCWCSNSAPGDTTSLSECDVACPGFGYEYCGDSSKGVFGYIALGSASTGSDGSSTGGYSSTENGYSSSQNGGSSTENGDSSTESGESSTEGDESSTTNGYSSTVDAPTSTSTEKAVVKTTFSSAKATLSSSKTTFSGANTGSGQTGASSAAESTAASSVSPVVSTFYSVATMTGDSQKTVTQTLLQTLTAASAVTATGEASGASGASGATAKSSGGFFSSTGRVAGVFTAVGVVAVAVLAGLFFFLRRKISGYRAAHNTYYRYSDEGGSPFGDDAASNVMPRLDYSDLESNAHQHDYPEKQETSAGSSSGGFVDPRLDPDGPLYRSAGDDYSNRSLSDDIDYSRKVLKVTNA